MRLSFVRFDSILIEHAFQPLADLIVYRAGIDRLRVIGLCLDAASIAWILSRAGALSDAVLQWSASPAFLNLALLLLGLAALRGLRTLFQRVSSRRGANPLRAAMLPHRGLVLALLGARLISPGGFADLADLAMLLLCAGALYLGACATPPPVRQRRWAGKARALRATV